MITDANGEPFTLGDAVEYKTGHVLHRVHIEPPPSNWRSPVVAMWITEASRDLWVGDGVSQHGIIAGERHLSNGTMHYDEDPYVSYRNTKQVQAVLISFDLRRKPVLVRAADVTITNPQTLEGAAS